MDRSDTAIIRAAQPNSPADAAGTMTKPFALDTLGAKVHAMIKGPAK
jgi:hypothetical protein